MASMGLQPRTLLKPDRKLPYPIHIPSTSSPAPLTRYRGGGASRIRVQSHASNSALSFSDPQGVYLKKTDSWMAESVADIVKNLGKAPLLVQIEDRGQKRRIRIDKAIESEWADMRSQWASDELKSPDGMIFVSELEGEPEADNGNCDCWGIVVQGKEPGSGPACYLLKTDKASGGQGLDFCVHFCLIRINNFRNSYKQHFKDSWLLR